MRHDTLLKLELGDGLISHHHLALEPRLLSSLCFDRQAHRQLLSMKPLPVRHSSKFDVSFGRCLEVVANGLLTNCCLGHSSSWAGTLRNGDRGVRCTDDRVGGTRRIVVYTVVRDIRTNEVALTCRTADVVRIHDRCRQRELNGRAR